MHNLLFCPRLRRTKLNVPLIQLPSVERDWLIADPSLSLSPVAPVDSALSLLKQRRNIPMKYINLPLTKGHQWVNNTWHCQAHRNKVRQRYLRNFSATNAAHTVSRTISGCTLFCTMHLSRCKLQGERTILALFFTLQGLLHVTDSLGRATYSRMFKG